MEYKDLELFNQLVEAGNLDKASQYCHLSPSTLSRRLKRMEEEAGARLFVRDSNPWQLTSQGVAFQQHAEQVLELWRQLVSSFQQESSQLSGELSIYCSVTASYSFLSDLLSQFRTMHPGVSIHVRTGDAAESIPMAQRGEVDMVVAARPDKLPASLSFKTMTSSPLVFIAPKDSSLIPELLALDPDWSQVPIVLSETGLARTRVDRWFKQKRVKPNIYAQVSGHEAIVSMVALGCGIGVVPDLVLKNSPMEGSVRVLDVQPELEPFAVGLCTSTRYLENPVIAALWQVAV